jgi:hypothetical protein
MQATQLQANVLPVSYVTVTDSTGKATTYQLVLDYNSLAKAEPLLSPTQEIKDEQGKVISPIHTRDLSVRFDWANLTGADLSVICWSAFDHFHPEVTLKQVRHWLAPAQNNQLFEMLFESAYPGVLAKLKEAAEEIAKTKNEPPIPNEQAAVSVQA